MLGVPQTARTTRVPQELVNEGTGEIDHEPETPSNDIVDKEHEIYSVRASREDRRR